LVVFIAYILIVSVTDCYIHILSSSAASVIIKFSVSTTEVANYCTDLQVRGAGPVDRNDFLSESEQPSISASQMMIDPPSIQSEAVKWPAQVAKL